MQGVWDSAPADDIVQVHDQLLAAVARLNERAEPSGRRMCLFLSTPRPYLRVVECPNSNDLQVADFLGVEK